MNLQLVYDITYQPTSIGDVLTHLQAANCLAEERGSPGVEVVILHDDRQRKIEFLGQAARMSDRVVSVQVVHKRHEREVLRPRWFPKGNHYSTYECWGLITDFFTQHKRLPSIKPHHGLVAWAEDYLAGAITLQVRASKHHPERNAKVEEWVKFVKANPVPIVIVCSPAEREARLSGPHVRFACDDFGLQQQLALVYASRIHLGSASGPAQMRWYQDKPFRVFSEPIKTNRVKGMTQMEGRKKMPWMTGFPLISGPETAGLIQTEFDAL